MNDPIIRTALAHDLRALTTAAAALHVGAHPDDEDSGLLAWLSLGQGVRSVYWSATRGEGGQNWAGDEAGDALGIRRTWESLAARRIDGAEVAYGPFRDFGFSKSGAATLARWGREQLVREIARAVRVVQPHVVICRWTGTPDDGHGHHEAVGMVTAEAVELAADPSELLDLDRAGLPPWRAVKLYRSMSTNWEPGLGVRLGDRDATLEQEGVVAVNTGAWDPVSGLTFQELATLGLNCHETQGMAVLPEPAGHYLYYRLDHALVAPPANETALFDGIDTSLRALADLAPSTVRGALRRLLGRAEDRQRAAFATLHPADPTPAGHELLAALGRLREARTLLPVDDAATEALARNLDRRVSAVERVAARCLGLRLDGVVDTSTVVPGQRLHLQARLWSPGGLPVTHEAIDVCLPPGWHVEERLPQPASAHHGALLSVDTAVRVPHDAVLSCPYWLRGPHGPDRYHWPPDAPAGAALDDPLVRVRAAVEVAGTPLLIELPAVHRTAFVGGTRSLPVAVVPPAALLPQNWAEILPVSSRRQQLDLVATVRTVEGAGEGCVVLATPAGWDAHPREVRIDGAGDDGVTSLRWTVTVPPATPPGTHRLAYHLRFGGRDDVVALETVRTSARGSGDEATATAEVHVPRPAHVLVHTVDVAFVERLSYGHVRGTGDLSGALARFPITVEEVSDHALGYGELGEYDAIVVGPGAYAVRPELQRRAGRLLEYVEAGGTLVVLHQGYGYDTSPMTPYRLRHGRPHLRVTDAGSPVELLIPDHPVFCVPNRLTAADFDGWVVERARYLLKSWDRRYAPLLATHDPGEASQHGGLLVTSYGYGTYAYVALTLDTQIRAGVAGAIRLFANLLGLAEARVLERRKSIRHVSLFADMTDHHLYEVARVLSERWIDAGELLCQQGDPSDELFVVLDGQVEVVRDDGAGPRRVATAGSGEVLGELATLTEEARSATLRATAATRVLVMAGRDFLGLLGDHPDIAHRVLRVLGRRLAKGSSG